MTKIFLWAALSTTWILAQALTPEANTKALNQVFELFKNNQYEQGHQELLNLHKAGSQDAALAIGNLYFHGKGVRQNYKDAYRWYKIALKRGNQKVKYALAGMYKDGIAVDRAYHKAFDLYLQSAIETQNPKSMFFVAAMYYHGEGIPQNFDKAYEWASKSAGLKESRAIFLMGLLYLNGQGVKQDLDEAFRYAKLAKTLGVTQAQELMTLIAQTHIQVNKQPPMQRHK